MELIAIHEEGTFIGRNRDCLPSPYSLEGFENGYRNRRERLEPTERMSKSKYINGILQFLRDELKETVKNDGRLFKVVGPKGTLTISEGISNVCLY